MTRKALRRRAIVRHVEIVIIEGARILFWSGAVIGIYCITGLLLRLLGVA